MNNDPRSIAIKRIGDLLKKVKKNNITEMSFVEDAELEEVKGQDGEILGFVPVGEMTMTIKWTKGHG